MQISLAINWKIVIFLIILELLTVPFVAISNTIVLDNQNYIVIMGFVLAFFALLVIMKLIIAPIKRYFSSLIGEKICKISGVLYLCIISGFLLMFMFYLQEVTYRFTRSDYIVGTVSAFFSVSVSLIIYTLIEKTFNYGIKVITKDNKSYLMCFGIKDIIVITLLFSLYETIASPLSILWVPHYTQRFIWGCISAVAAGVGGSIPMVIICNLVGYKITIRLKQVISKPQD